MTTYGYCRISNKKQNIDRQIRNIKAIYPSAIIIEEKYTGTKLEGRDKWNVLYEKVMKQVAKEPVKIVFDSVSRMSRNAEIGIEQYKALYNAGVTLEFINEPMINTETYREAERKQIAAVDTGDNAANELVNTIIAAIQKYMMDLAAKQIEIAFQQAAKEVEDLHTRTKQGLITAAANGKQIGAVKGQKNKVKKEAPAKEAIKKYNKDFGGSLSDVETMKLCGVSHNTYYKYKRELLAEEQ